MIAIAAQRWGSKQTLSSQVFGSRSLPEDQMRVSVGAPNVHLARDPLRADAKPVKPSELTERRSTRYPEFATHGESGRMAQTKMAPGANESPSLPVPDVILPGAWITIWPSGINDH